MTFEEKSDQKLVYFWGLGDLHFRAIPAWNEFHQKRFATLFSDLHTLWQQEGQPAFCVSPGDLIETGTIENYALVKTVLNEQLGNIPFYPGVGNHEYYEPEGKNPDPLGETFTTQWGMPLRYTWQVGGVTCIMLDYPDPLTLANPAEVYLMPETLAFLDEALARTPDNPSLIFLHCPLRGTVLDRDPEQHRDYNSLQRFFSPENSQDVRDILARHRNACLFVSGHTHSGWEAPDLVKTEQPGGHPVTFVNLLSPWYTGTRSSPHLSQDHQSFHYILDEPDIIPTLAFHVYRDRISIRVRDHLSQQWLKEWTVPSIDAK